MSATDDAKTLRDSFGENILSTAEFRGETTVNVALDALHDVMAKCRNELGYEIIHDIASLDHFGEHPRFEMVYHICTLDDAKHLRLKAKVARRKTCRA